jgi:hypothetical protein
MLNARFLQPIFEKLIFAASLFLAKRELQKAMNGWELLRL